MDLIDKKHIYERSKKKKRNEAKARRQGKSG
jgi:hypothetical protein